MTKEDTKYKIFDFWQYFTLLLFHYLMVVNERKRPNGGTKKTD